MLESISKLRGNEYQPQLFIYDCQYCLNNNLKNINSKKRINRLMNQKLQLRVKLIVDLKNL